MRPWTASASRITPPSCRVIACVGRPRRAAGTRRAAHSRKVRTDRPSAVARAAVETSARRAQATHARAVRCTCRSATGAPTFALRGAPRAAPAGRAFFFRPARSSRKGIVSAISLRNAVVCSASSSSWMRACSAAPPRDARDGYRGRPRGRGRSASSAPSSTRHRSA